MMSLKKPSRKIFLSNISFSSTPRFFYVLVSFAFIFSICIFSTSLVQAQTIDELKSKISQRNDNIKQLEEEIKTYQSQIEAVGKEADSLKNTLVSLDLSKKKLETSLAVTQNKIENTNLEIRQLSLQIDDKSVRIGDSKRVVSQSLASIAETDATSLFETILGSQNLADMWNGVEELATLQTSITNRIHELQSVKTSLESNKAKTEVKKKELLSLQKDLANQKKLIAETTKEKNALLVETKNTEANYKQLLATKKSQKDAFEREVFDLESALKIAIDPKSIPSTGSGVLQWPLDVIRITQYFGNTNFAARNPQAYSGKGHNGVDFAAPIGTPVKSALSGVVVGSGDMDLVNGGRCRSYGKWIMVRHNNGLSTLYGHLSLIKVEQNQEVATGEIIAYSGNTGYTTGPHLHFSVYATEGVRITRLTNSINCRDAVIPLADLKAYLNPLSYLP